MIVIAMAAFTCATVGIGYMLAMLRRDDPYLGLLGLSVITLGAIFSAVHAALNMNA